MERSSQNLIFNELEKTFHQNHLVVSIVNKPNNRKEPIIGFSFGMVKNEVKPISSEENSPNSSFIILNPQTISQQNRLTFSLFDQKYGLFDTKQYQVLTDIISLTIDKPESMENVKMNFFLGNHFQEKNQTIRCAYWHIYENMTANGLQMGVIWII